MSAFEVTVRNERNPRGVRIDAGSEFSGIDITARRDGVYVSGFYDSMVGLDGLFLTWDDITRLRVLALMTHTAAEMALPSERFSWKEPK